VRSVSDRVVTAIHRADQIDSDLVEQWRELEARSSLGNAYLSPDFQLPAMRYLEPERSPWVVRAELGANPGRLIGIAVFTRSGPTTKIPFPHLKLFESKHSFAKGILLDREYRVVALVALLRAMFARYWSLGLFVSDLRVEGDCFQVLSSPDFSYFWEELTRFPRAIVKPSPDFGEGQFSSQVKKNLRRCWKKLSELGNPEWRLVRSADEMPRAVDSFLRLEHMGWKGTDGSSLLSSVAETQFFRDLVRNFTRRQEVLFLELCLNGEPISSASVFLSGKSAFGFKIGWNPEYRAIGPGALSAVELARRLPEFGAGMELMDSCSKPGSWTEKYWPDSYPVVSGFIVPRGLGAAAVTGLKAAYELKCSLAEHWRREPKAA
jgi:CelD/BcsL family acetyltransferase involved in cellulose biosynthesis